MTTTTDPGSGHEAALREIHRLSKGMFGHQNSTLYVPIDTIRLFLMILDGQSQLANTGNSKAAMARLAMRAEAEMIVIQDTIQEIAKLSAGGPWAQRKVVISEAP
ncbi:MAG: hypothetical protein AAGI03_02770 [Pseudomonadota bacterium]